MKPKVRRKNRHKNKRALSVTALHNIHIVNRNGDVDNPDVYLNRPAGDQAAWLSDGGEFAVIFHPKTPFQHFVFTVPDRGIAYSGPITGRKGTYPYAVVGSSRLDVDPNIHIGP